MDKQYCIRCGAYMSDYSLTDPICSSCHNEIKTYNEGFVDGSNVTTCQNKELERLAYIGKAVEDKLNHSRVCVFKNQDGVLMLDDKSWNSISPLLD